MTLRTITFDDEQWQVVPKKMAPVMWHAATAAHDAIGAWVAALANAPEPPAQEPINQCDGCRRGLPVNERGIHRGEGYDLIACTAHLYRAPAQQPMTDDADPDTIAALLKERDALRGLVSAITDNRGKCFIPTLGTDTPDALLNWDERARAALADGEASNG